MNNVELGNKLARAVFEAGRHAENNTPVLRIAFKHRHGPQQERDGCGLNEVALALVLTEALDDVGLKGT